MKRGSTLRFVLNAVLIVVSMVAITVIVRVSGGANGIAVHFYYLPIIWAGYLAGDVGALLAGLLAALLCGPMMPADVTAPDPERYWQDPADIGLRTLFFFVVGMASSRVGFILRQRATEFETLYHVARSVSSSLRLESVLKVIADSAEHVMNVRACAIRLLDRDRGLLQLRASRGLSRAYLAKGPVKVAQSPIDMRVLDGETVAMRNVTDSGGFQYVEEAAREGLTSVLSVPLSVKDEVLGVMRVYAHAERAFSRDEIALLEAFANLAAIAIENAQLYEDIRRSYYETVRALTIAIEARDPVTYGHSERVTAVAQRLGERLGLSEEELEVLRFSTILHDIGKIGVEGPALDARLDPDVDLRMFYEMHPLIGRSILAPVQFLHPICEVVLYHHERWDGAGFPEGLAGEQIPFQARLVAIVDTYDRLVNGVDEFGGATPADAFAQIRLQSGSAFDPSLIDVFMQMSTEEIARRTLDDR
ncbi:MAG: HD domain-containing protein [Armatimonadetes bacterium]|nr:HD domain-containing protein [Armatimonadota bacterium]